IAVSPGNGQITVTFYDRRNDTSFVDGDPVNTRMALVKAVSTDGGLTWFNQQVSSVAFKPATGYDMGALGSMGDYNYVVADAANFFLTWTDCRNVCTPPAGSVNPCSPARRPDRDVFYSRDAVLSGPDLFITPWGDI